MGFATRCDSRLWKKFRRWNSPKWWWKIVMYHHGSYILVLNVKITLNQSKLWNLIDYEGVFSTNWKNYHVEMWSNNGLHQLCLLPPQTLHTSWKMTPGSPWRHHCGKTSLHLLVQKQALGADISSKKCQKKCVRVAFHCKIANASSSI